jgi:hypothetical protein
MGQGQGEEREPDMTAEGSASIDDWDTTPHTLFGWSGGGLKVRLGRLCPVKNPDLDLDLDLHDLDLAQNRLIGNRDAKRRGALEVQRPGEYEQAREHW